MDPSCECLCDCERWASNIQYRHESPPRGSGEFLIESLLCHECYAEACILYEDSPIPNPWKNT